MQGFARQTAHRSAWADRNIPSVVAAAEQEGGDALPDVLERGAVDPAAPLLAGVQRTVHRLGARTLTREAASLGIAVVPYLI